ncbi:hypothetical protein C8R45DRAFT_1075105 [Mycena sanguinolenta]|nr:hypothetical protein C8R45DRAFT_1075105 [Mycena sanguinolenta]
MHIAVGCSSVHFLRSLFFVFGDRLCAGCVNDSGVRSELLLLPHATEFSEWPSILTKTTEKANEIESRLIQDLSSVRRNEIQAAEESRITAVRKGKETVGTKDREMQTAGVDGDGQRLEWVVERRYHAVDVAMGRTRKNGATRGKEDGDGAEQEGGGADEDEASAVIDTGQERNGGQVERGMVAQRDRVGYIQEHKRSAATRNRKVVAGRVSVSAERSRSTARLKKPGCPKKQRKASIDRGRGDGEARVIAAEAEAEGVDGGLRREDTDGGCPGTRMKQSIGHAEPDEDAARVYTGGSTDADPDAGRALHQKSAPLDRLGAEAYLLGDAGRHGPWTDAKIVESGASRASALTPPSWKRAGISMGKRRSEEKRKG